jgi:hypothetical protein
MAGSKCEARSTTRKIRLTEVGQKAMRARIERAAIRRIPLCGGPWKVTLTKSFDCRYNFIDYSHRQSKRGAYPNDQRLVRRPHDLHGLAEIQAMEPVANRQLP